MTLIRSMFRRRQGASRSLSTRYATVVGGGKALSARWLFVEVAETPLHVDHTFGGALAALSAARAEKLNAGKDLKK